MFCTKCGYKLSDDSLFCQKCGTRLTPMKSEVEISEKQTDKADLDREAVEIYLRDVLNLECIKKKYLSAIQTLDKTINNLDGEWYWWRYEIKSERKIHNRYVFLRYDGTKAYIAWQNYQDCVYLRDILSEEAYWRELDSKTKQKLNSSLAWRRASYPYCGIFDGDGRREISRDYFIKEILPYFESNCQKMYDDNKETVVNAKIDKEGILNELKQVDDILKRLYNINIIPLTYRNIYAIYYLYDYMRSSRESLTSALLHCDLNEIKSKLDIIIEQQQEIIIQQSILISQNKEVMDANREKLDRLAQIEKNTAMAAEYSEIAASNAYACAWIAAANYVQRTW